MRSVGSHNVVELGSTDDVLDATARLRRVGPGEGDLVIAVPGGAPLLAHPVFLAALRGVADGRPVVLVTDDERARAMASGLRVPAYASLSAYVSRSVDPTERLEAARRAALARIARVPRRTWRIERRAAAAVAMVLAASLAVLAPSAELVVAGNTAAVGPLQLELRTIPSGAIAARELSEQVTAKVQGRASGSRVELAKASGAALFKNLRTDPVTIPAGTRVWTEQNVRFTTTQTKTVPASIIVPFLVSAVLIPIEAEQAGKGGNVSRDTITNAEEKRVLVTNPDPTSGGDERRIPIVRQEDYAAAATRLEDALNAAAQERLGRWKQEPPSEMRVEDAVARTDATRTPLATEIVGREVATFELQGTARARAYAVPAAEPRQTALRELAEATQDGYALLADSAALEVAPAITGDGITWRVTARGTQRPRLDEWSLRLALWGADRARVEALLAERDLTLVSLRSHPEWWPRLPVLPLRIAVRETAVAAAR
jgi:hypothetical protein